MELRAPIAYKIHNGYLWCLAGKKPTWEMQYWTYGEKEVSVINQRFGENLVSFYKDLGMDGHNGTDWYCPSGITIFAVQDATVGWVNQPNNDNGYGGFIELLWGDNRYIYGHLSEVFVQPGQKVYAGRPIGLTGNTGKYTTGPHLHTALMKMNGPIRLNTDNGYLGYIDDAPYYDKLTAYALTPVEEMYWEWARTRKSYYGLFGTWRWNAAKKRLGLTSEPHDRGEFHDYSIKHKE